MHVLFLDNTDTVEASVKKLGEHLIQISGAEVNLSGFHLLNDAGSVFGKYDGFKTLYKENEDSYILSNDGISATLGIPNRGVKYTHNLYVLRKTHSPAILIECCFVDSQNDASHWDADKCGDAIASAIVGKTVSGTTSSGSTPVATPVAKPAASTGNNWVRRLQTACNTQGFSNQRVDGIPGKNTLAGCPTCRKGARGNITRLIQERLNSLGFNCGKVDGIFGGGTRAAVIAFQRAHGLSADGIVGKNTWRALLGL